jgi:tetratricopeptide (TPR) repeat protein
MKVRRLLTIGLFLIVLAGCQDPRKADLDLFNQANAAYKKGDYQTAAKLYQKIGDSGVASEQIYYNLGNAHMKAGQLGRAMVAYERALRLKPRDSDLKANVEFAKSRIQTPEPDGPSSGIFIHLKEVTLDEIVVILTAVVIAISIFILAGLFLRWRFRKTALAIGLLTLVFVFHLFALLAKIDDLADRAVILAQTDVKYEPESAATTHFTASEGWKVRILKESSGWVKVERPDGLEGWVPKEKIERI